MGGASAICARFKPGGGKGIRKRGAHLYLLVDLASISDLPMNPPSPSVHAAARRNLNTKARVTGRGRTIPLMTSFAWIPTAPCADPE